MMLLNAYSPNLFNAVGPINKGTKICTNNINLASNAQRGNYSNQFQWNLSSPTPTVPAGQGHNIQSFQDGQHYAVPVTNNAVPVMNNASNTLKNVFNENIKDEWNETYVDFSRVCDEQVTETSVIQGDTYQSIINPLGNLNNDNTRTRGRAENRGIYSFPRKLHKLLDRSEFKDVITWLPHGRSFIIYDSDRFMTEVLPRYFKGGIKYRTFQRQLNIWNFKRITMGIDEGSYYSQFFLRGMPNLVKKMEIRRNTDNKRMNRSRSCSKKDLDFYRLSQYRPLRDLKANKSELP